MKKIQLFFTALVVLALSATAYAQKLDVTGVVSDASTGDALPGVAVQLKGSTTTYALTDASGSYKITVPSDGTLVISCLGYGTKEVAVSGHSVLNIGLSADTETLDDVIVVAYGTVRREAKTGSVSQIKGDILAEAPVSSVDKMLSGKMAGVQVTAQSGQPGAASQIRIRGISSINAGSSPLWVVDGIPVSSGDESYFTNTSTAMSVINPNDIESITVLKDAAASSIYGSRAANGVILVTTKSGKSGKAQFTARAKFGASQLANDNNYRMMTGQELLDYQRTAAVNAGFNPDDPNSKYYVPKELVTRPLTNWLKEMLRVGILQEYEINASAGNDKGKFYSSFNYQKNNGIARGIDFQKFTARVNSDYKLTKTLSIGTRVNLAYQESNDIPMQDLYYSNPIFAGMAALPWTPFYDEDGNYNVYISELSNNNPLYTALHDDQWEKQFRVHGTAFLEWKPVKGLSFKTNNSVETTFGEGRRYWGPLPGETEGTLQCSTTQFLTLTTSNTATYANEFGDHSLRVVLGQEGQSYQYHYYYGSAPGVDANIPYFTTAVASTDQTAYSGSKETLLSFFGMADYSYASRYFLQASVRGDGSSLFGANNRWGLFWSVGASWNISNEKWMKATRNWLSLLKIRASYGISGNNGIAAYRAYGVYASAAYNGVNGMLPSTPDNANLSWEKNKEWNVGIDAGFFDSRLNVNLDFYRRTTTDMLLSKQVPQTSGFSTNFMNIGSLYNQGFEAQIDATLIANSNWRWTLGGNISFNKSHINNLGDSEYLSYSSEIRHVVGKQFYTFYLKDYAGVNPANGDALWHTEDGGITNDYKKARYVYCGSPEPLFTAGINTSLSWKGFALSIFLDGKYGNKVLIGERSIFLSDGARMNMNQSTEVLNYWKKPGDTNCNPRPVAGNSSSSNSSVSTRFLEDGSYLRLKDITLSYTFPKHFKVYVSGMNLYTFHNVHFFDPERGVDGLGVGIYPMTKTLVGGVEITF